MCTRRSWALPRGLGRPVVVRVWRDAARSSLAAPVRRPRMARARADGCRLIRRGAAGLGNPAGAGARGGQEHTGRQGRRRVVRERLAGLAAAPRGRERPLPPRPPPPPPVVAALAGAGDWPVAHAAPAPRGRGRPPPRGEPVTLSRAPPCVDQGRDLVGLSLSPPGRPMRPGRAERRPHDAPRPGPPRWAPRAPSPPARAAASASGAPGPGRSSPASRGAPARSPRGGLAIAPGTTPPPTSPRRAKPGGPGTRPGPATARRPPPSGSPRARAGAPSSCPASISIPALPPGARGGAAVPPQAVAAGRPPLAPATRHRPPGLPRPPPPQRNSHALQVDPIRRRQPRRRQTLLLPRRTQLMLRT